MFKTAVETAVLTMSPTSPPSLHLVFLDTSNLKCSLWILTKYGSKLASNQMGKDCNQRGRNGGLQIVQSQNHK